MMKKINIYLLLASIFFISFATTCPQQDVSCERETLYVDFEVVKIKVQPNNNLTVNDTIWLSLEVPNKIKDINGKYHTLNLENGFRIENNISTEIKNNFNEYSSVNFGSFFIQKHGEINTSNGTIHSKLLYDTNSNSLKYNFGLILKEKGTYKFNTGNIYNLQNGIYEDCPKYSYNFNVHFENGTINNKQIYLFTVN